MKKWSVRVYLVLVHLLLVGLLAHAGWLYAARSSIPMRFEWHDLRRYANDPAANPFDLAVDNSALGIATIGDERIAIFHFEDGRLDGLTFGWPDRGGEYSLSDKGIAFSTDRSVLGRAPNDTQDPREESFFVDRTGDGVFDTSRTNGPDGRVLRWAEWKTITRQAVASDTTPDGARTARHLRPAGPSGDPRHPVHHNAEV